MNRIGRMLLRALLLVGLLLVTGCQWGLPREDAGADREDFSSVSPESSLLKKNPPSGEDGLGLLRAPTQPSFEIVVIHVRVPETAAAQAREVWKHFREEIGSGMTQLALRDNGLRVGIGHADWWDPVRSTFENIEEQITTVAQPVSIPAGFPLALELDTEPRDQTLFYVGRDGILSGSTWSNSRNVLSVSYQNDPTDPQQVQVAVVPEVRRQEEGLRIMQTPAGIWQVPRREVQMFDAAGFEATLAPGEFLLIGASVGDLATGLLGDSFLRQELDGVPYISYIVLRPEVVGVGEDE